jgi:hypothetical protein
MDINYARSIGGLIRAVPATGFGTTVAANVGVAIDRQLNPLAAGMMPLSALGVVHYNVVLTAGQTLGLTWTLDDSADGTTWTNLIPALATPQIVQSGTGTFNGCANFEVPLSNARRYVRFGYTPTTASATLSSAAELVMGGWGRVPTAHF